MRRVVITAISNVFAYSYVEGTGMSCRVECLLLKIRPDTVERSTPWVVSESFTAFLE